MTTWGRFSCELGSLPRGPRLSESPGLQLESSDSTGQGAKDGGVWAPCVWGNGTPGQGSQLRWPKGRVLRVGAGALTTSVLISYASARHRLGRGPKGTFLNLGGWALGAPGS